jgi:hypothetical protein
MRHARVINGLFRTLRSASRRVLTHPAGPFRTPDRSETESQYLAVKHISDCFGPSRGFDGVAARLDDKRIAVGAAAGRLERARLLGGNVLAHAVWAVALATAQGSNA